MGIGERDNFSAETYRHPLTESVDTQNSSNNAVNNKLKKIFLKLIILTIN